MTLTKDQIVGSLQRRLGVSKSAASPLNPVLDTIKSSLANGEDVLISGLGNSA